MCVTGSVHLTPREIGNTAILHQTLSGICMADYACEFRRYMRCISLFAWKADASTVIVENLQLEERVVVTIDTWVSVVH